MVTHEESFDAQCFLFAFAKRIITTTHHVTPHLVCEPKAVFGDKKLILSPLGLIKISF
jgi:hypothetical protein